MFTYIICQLAADLFFSKKGSFVTQYWCSALRLQLLYFFTSLNLMCKQKILWVVIHNMHWTLLPSSTGYLKFNCWMKRIWFLASTLYTNDPLKKSVSPREKIEVKKWEFCQTKKNLIYQFFYRKLFMINFHLRIVQNWDSRVREPRLSPLKGLEPLNLGRQISILNYIF